MPTPINESAPFELLRPEQYQPQMKGKLNPSLNPSPIPTPSLPLPSLSLELKLKLKLKPKPKLKRKAKPERKVWLIPHIHHSHT